MKLGNSCTRVFDPILVISRSNLEVRKIMHNWTNAGEFINQGLEDIINFVIIAIFQHRI